MKNKCLAFVAAILECETPLQDPGHFLELLASSQARRLDDQRVSMSHFPGLRLSTSSPPCTPPTSSTDQARQGNGMLEQSCHMGSFFGGGGGPGLNPGPKSVCFLPAPSPGTDTPQTPSLYSRLEANAEHPEGDEVFFDMLVKCQVGWPSQIFCSRNPSVAATVLGNHWHHHAEATTVSHACFVTSFTRAPGWTTRGVLPHLPSTRGQPFRTRTFSASSSAPSPTGWRSSVSLPRPSPHNPSRTDPFKTFHLAAG